LWETGVDRKLNHPQEKKEEGNSKKKMRRRRRRTRFPTQFVDRMEGSHFDGIVFPTFSEISESEQGDHILTTMSRQDEEHAQGKEHEEALTHLPHE
jgi:hypothetical protein